MIRVSCPKCKTILQVQDKHAGQVVACSKCQTSMRLPSAPPALPPSPPVPLPPVSKSGKPSPLAATTPTDKGDSQKAPGSAAASPSKDQARNIVGRLKTFWRDARTPIKAAVIGGTSVMFLSCFLCCGILGFNTFRPSPDSKAKDGGAAQAPPEIAKVDFSKGPNGEDVVKVEDAKRVFFAFQNKAKTKVRHGLFTEFFDKDKTKKKVEGNFFAGEWHGKVTRWYATGELQSERHYDRGKNVGTHKGFAKEGGLEWDLRFDSEGVPVMKEATALAFVNQIGLHFDTDKWAVHKTTGEIVFDTVGHPGPRPARPQDIPFTQYMLQTNNGTSLAYSRLLALVGPPCELYRNRKSKDSRGQIWVYECRDGVVRLQVDNPPRTFGDESMAIPTGGHTLNIVRDIYVGGDRKF